MPSSRLQDQYQAKGQFTKAKSVLAIHNIAFQVSAARKQIGEEHAACEWGEPGGGTSLARARAGSSH
jgi:hypothetical protein